MQEDLVTIQEIKSFMADGDVDASKKIVESCTSQVEKYSQRLMDDWYEVRIAHQSTQLAISGHYVLFVITVTFEMTVQPEPEEEETGEVKD